MEAKSNMTPDGEKVNLSDANGASESAPSLRVIDPARGVDAIDVINAKANPALLFTDAKNGEIGNEIVQFGTFAPEILARKIDICMGDSKEATSWPRSPMTIGEFINIWLARHPEDSSKNGKAFLQGRLIPGNGRKSAAMEYLDILALDIDTGQDPIEVARRIAEKRRACVITTTHSSGATISPVKRDAVVRHAKCSGEPTIDDVCSYLTNVKRWRPHVLKGVEIVETKTTNEGTVIIVRHAPLTKFRVVLFLEKRYYPGRRGGTDKQGRDEWANRYRGVSQWLEAFCDNACTDVSRLFFTPRHKPGAAYDVMILAGGLLDLDSIEPVKKGNGADSDNPWARAANDMGAGDGKEYRTPGLKKFAKDHAHHFEVVDFFDEFMGEENRGPCASVPGYIFRCPWEDDHSEPESGDRNDDKGFYAINASESEKDKPSFTIKCSHDGCAERDRLDFLDQFICDNPEITIADLERHCFRDLEEEEEEEEAEEAAAETKPQQPPDDREPTSRYTKKNKRDKKKSRGKMPEESEAVLHEMNERAAVVKVRGKTGILIESSNPDELPAVGKQADFTLFFNNMPTIEDTDGEHKKPPFVWIKWPPRRTYDGLTCDPTGAVTKGTDADSTEPYNLWKGHAVRGAPGGDWSLLRGHIHDTVCHGNEDWNHWFLTWLANHFANPERKFGSCAVIKGKRGTGKGKIFDWLRVAIGRRHSIKIANGKQLTGQFNGHLAGKIHVTCEEALWAGDRAAGGVLKDLVTSTTLPMEDKFQAVIEVPNLVRLAFISNESWVVPAALDDERRFFVLEILPKWGAHDPDGTTKFFAALDAQMEAGGLAAMVHDLTNWDPTAAGKYPAGWDVLRNPPRTPWLTEQGMASLERGEAFFVDMLQRGGCKEVRLPNGDLVLPGFLFEAPPPSADDDDDGGSNEPPETVLKSEDADGRLYLPTVWLRDHYQHWLARNVANADARVQLLQEHRVREMVQKWLCAWEGDGRRTRYGKEQFRCLTIPSLVEIIAHHAANGRDIKVD